MWHTHHWHAFQTTLKRVSLDCVGEEVRWYRCCGCKRVSAGTPFSFWSISGASYGQAENRHAYDVHHVSGERP